MKLKPTYQELEEELKEIRFNNNLIEKSPIVKFVWKNQENWPVEYVSENVKNIFGYSADDFMKNKIVYSEIIFPEDLPRVENEVSAQSKIGLSSIEHEPYRIINKSGEIKWLNDVTLIRRNENKKITHFEGIIIDITKQKEIEKELVESELRWKFAVEGNADGLWDWNLITNEVFFSTQWKKMLGFSENEIQGSLQEWDNRVHPDDKEKVYQDINKHINGEADFYENEHRVLCKDNTYKWILDRGKIISYTSDNKPERIIGTHSDISGRKKTEEALKESEEKILSWLENSQVCVKAVDLDFNLQFMSPTGIKQLKIEDITEFYGKPYPLEFYPEAFKNTMFNNLKKAIETGEVVKQEDFVFDIEGNKIWYYSTIVPVKDEKGKIKYLIVESLETTERKQAEIALKKSEDRLSKTLIAANDGMWDWNLITNKVYFDPRYYEMAGYAVDEFPHEFEEFQKRIHSDDVENVMLQAQQHLKGEIPRFNVEFRFKKKSGDWLWIMARGQIVERDKNNKPLRFIGTHADISERKKAEVALQKSEEKFNTIANFSYDWEYWISPQNEFIYISPSCERITGYSPNEFKQNLELITSIVHPDDVANLKNHKHNIFDNKEIDPIEFRIITKSGEERWIGHVCQTIYNADGVNIGIRGSNPRYYR